MKIRTALSYPFKNWLSPLLFSIAVIPVFVLSIFVDVGLVKLIGGGLLFIALAWLIISSFVLLFKGQWAKFFYTLLFISTMAMVVELLQID